MLISGPDLIDAPVLSLQTGSELARTENAVINPHNLSIVAFEVNGPTLDQYPSLLRTQDIRELGPIGMIIDSSDEFVQPEDVIKLNDIYQLHFNLIDKPVLDEKRNKLGKVLDYTIDSNSFVIQQINVKKPLMKSFNDGELLVHRSQVIEVTDTAIVIKSKAKASQPLPKEGRNYANPFRQSSPQAEGIDIQKK
jgi:uncharacterized protein YrrD